MRSRQSFQPRQHMLAGDYEIYHYQDTRLANVNPHHHDFYECYFFIGGAVRFLIEGKSYDLKSGDVVLINTRELHQVEILDMTVPYERMVLWLARDFVTRLSAPDADLSGCFIQPGRRNIIRADIETQQHIRTLFAQILALQDATSFGRDLMIHACLTQLLVLVNNEVLSAGTRPSVDVRRNQLIEDVLAYIGDHLEESLQIADLADVFFLSKFHLARQFQRQTGTTIHRFIIQKKLILAKELIQQGIPVGEVYLRCGFGNYSSFFRAFRSEYSLTPRQYSDQLGPNRNNTATTDPAR